MLPIIKVTVPLPFYDHESSPSSSISMDNLSPSLGLLKVFFDNGYHIVRPDPQGLATSSFDADRLNDEIKGICTTDPAPYHAIVGEPKFHQMLCGIHDVNMKLKYSFIMSKTLQCCYFCRLQTDESILKKCSRCRSVTYCSVECSRKDWKDRHKLVCKKERL